MGMTIALVAVAAPYSFRSRMASDFNSSRLMAPRSTVIRVKSDLWKNAVNTYACYVSAIVIDVTDMTANISWEVQYCLELYKEKTLLVGSKHRLQKNEYSNRENQSMLEKLIWEKGVIRYVDIKDKGFRNRLKQALDKINLPFYPIPKTKQILNFVL